ncbi:MAG: hypothetical protein HYZ71_04735 [Deltaproteobacteria bacterium]|nr:hypothetical protein [Deltaproteobacteria bacterium]
MATSRTSLSAKERALYSKLRLLLNEPGLVRGNLVEMKRSCGKKSCKCQTDPEAKHRSLYLGMSIAGKHRMIYIPSAWEDRLREWTSRYSELRDLLEQISLESIRRIEERKG